VPLTGSAREPRSSSFRSRSEDGQVGWRRWKRGPLRYALPQNRDGRGHRTSSESAPTGGPAAGPNPRSNTCGNKAQYPAPLTMMRGRLETSSAKPGSALRPRRRGLAVPGKALSGSLFCPKGRVGKRSSRRSRLRGVRLSPGGILNTRVRVLRRNASQSVSLARCPTNRT
jgi:hypothetical protein